MPPKPPIVKLNGPYAGVSGQQVIFNTAGTKAQGGKLALWSIAFGDGQGIANANGAPPLEIPHTYDTPGSYMATLSVRTNQGLGGQDAANVEVTQAAPQPEPELRGATVTTTSGVVWTFGANKETLRDGAWYAGGLGLEYLYDRANDLLYVLGINGMWYLEKNDNWSEQSRNDPETGLPTPQPGEPTEPGEPEPPDTGGGDGGVIVGPGPTPLPNPPSGVWLAPTFDLNPPVGREVVLEDGVYSPDELHAKIGAHGTVGAWVLVRPRNIGKAVLKGGIGFERECVIVQDVGIDGRLHKNFPNDDGAIFCLVPHVRFRRINMVGTQDVHTGYNRNGVKSCGESDGIIPSGGAFGVDRNVFDVVWEDIVVSGFYGGGTMSVGSQTLLLRAYIRNCFSGLAFEGAYGRVQDSVFWELPNHNLNASCPDTSIVEVINTLIMDSQEITTTWEESGLGRAIWKNNTMYVPPNKPCYTMDGAGFAPVRDRVTFRNNIVYLTFKAWVGVAASVQNVDCNHNIYWHHDTSATDDFRDTANGLENQNLTRAQWQAKGRDLDSQFVRPLFVGPLPNYPTWDDTPDYMVAPATLAEARALFALQPGSPGLILADDGGRVGIR